MSATELTTATSSRGACAQDKSLSPETVVVGVVDPAATASPGGRSARRNRSFTSFAALVDGQDGR